CFCFLFGFGLFCQFFSFLFSVRKVLFLLLQIHLKKLPVQPALFLFTDFLLLPVILQKSFKPGNVSGNLLKLSFCLFSLFLRIFLVVLRTEKAFMVYAAADRTGLALL